MSIQIGAHMEDTSRICAEVDMLFVKENKQQNVMCVELVWGDGHRISFFLRTRHQARFLAAQLSTLADDVRIMAKQLDSGE